MEANKPVDSTQIFAKEILKGQVAIVTGGSNGGMLKQTVEAFLKHSIKAVVMMSRSQEKITKVASELSQFGTCEGFAGDVRKFEDCEKVVKYTVEKYGRVDILVNGAAGNFLAQAEKLSTNGFKTVMEIDTIGTFNMSKAAYVGAMKAQKSGNIVNFSAELHWNGSIF
jgi:peroxisomal 2,4-dienoyl-CoA reductase